MTSSNTATNDGACRTQAQAVAEVRYAIEYGAMNERLWQRLDTALNLTQATAGALALAGAMATQGRAAAVAGVVLAIVSALQLTLQPTRRSVAFRDVRLGLHDLAKRAWQLPLAELDAALEDVRKTAPQGLAALGRPAFNAVQRQHGHADKVLPLRWHERLAAALA